MLNREYAIRSFNSSEKYESQWEGTFPYMKWKIKKCSSHHQPKMVPTNVALPSLNFYGRPSMIAAQLHL